MTLKVGMNPRARGLKVNKVYINDDPGLTLTYFTAMSNVVKIAYCAYARPRCQVSVYRTIGPLVTICICKVQIRNNIYYSKKVLHHQIFTKIYKYHYFLRLPNLNFKFDTALEDSIQYLTQQ